METAKQANAIIRDAFALLTDKKDIERFGNIKEIFNNAAGMVNGNEYCEAILKGWMVSQANNIVFLLWRRGLMTPEIEAAYRELPSTEEAVKDYDDFEESVKKEAEGLEEQRKAFAAKQRDIDIFKAVLNGMSKEKAEAEYNRYTEQISRAARG
jgi:hypothetical protein